jgi:hypothetical protein
MAIFSFFSSKKAATLRHKFENNNLNFKFFKMDEDPRGNRIKVFVRVKPNSQ